MLKSTNKHVGIFSFIGNNILMFYFYIGVWCTDYLARN